MILPDWFRHTLGVLLWVMASVIVAGGCLVIVEMIRDEWRKWRRAWRERSK